MVRPLVLDWLMHINHAAPDGFSLLNPISFVHVGRAT